MNWEQAQGFALGTWELEWQGQPLIIWVGVCIITLAVLKVLATRRGRRGE
jgi:hypothetical protein